MEAGEANFIGSVLFFACLSFSCKLSSNDSKVTACLVRPGIDLLED
jgi:hypothetical protein